MVHFFAVLLMPEVEILGVDEELGEVVKLGNQLPHIRHLSGGVSETVSYGNEEPVGDVELASLQEHGALGVGVQPHQILQDDGQVGVVEPKVVRMDELILVVDFNAVLDLHELFRPLLTTQSSHALLQIPIVIV